MCLLYTVKYNDCYPLLIHRENDNSSEELTLKANATTNLHLAITIEEGYKPFNISAMSFSMISADSRYITICQVGIVTASSYIILRLSYGMSTDGIITASIYFDMIRESMYG